MASLHISLGKVNVDIHGDDADEVTEILAATEDLFTDVLDNTEPAVENDDDGYEDTPFGEGKTTFPEPRFADWEKDLLHATAPEKFAFRPDATEPPIGHAIFEHDAAVNLLQAIFPDAKITTEFV